MGRWVAFLALYALVGLWVLGVPVAGAQLSAPCCFDAASGSCVSSSDFTSSSLFSEYCRVSGRELDTLCTSKCSTVCCCAISDKAGINWQELNKDESWLKKPSATCNAQMMAAPGAFSSKTPTGAQTCVQLCATGTGVTPSSSFSVSGVVRNHTNNDLLAGQTVRIVGYQFSKSTTTDAAGRFTISAVPTTTSLTLVVLSPQGCTTPTLNIPALTSDYDAGELLVTCGSTTACAPKAPTLTATPLSETSIQLKSVMTNECGYPNVQQTLTQCAVAAGQTQCNPATPIAPLASTSQLDATLTAQSLQQNTRYCFMSTGFFSGAVVSSSVVCSGVSGPCSGKSDGQLLCGQDTSGKPAVLVCQKGQTKVSQSCTDSELCIEAQGAAGTVARCKQDPCRGCNGLLGILPYYDLFYADFRCQDLKRATPPLCAYTRNFDTSRVMLANAAGSTVTSATSSALSGASSGVLNSVFSAGTTQNAPRIVDALTSCTNIFSCDQYSHSGACSANPCAVKGSCAWRTLNAELGQGLCIDASLTGAAPCEQCAALLGTCDESTCSELGKAISQTAQSSCYYSRTRDTDGQPLGCLSAASMACSRYNSRADCVSASQGASFDITYASQDPSSRSGRTNARVTSSLDVLGLGVCTWVETAEGGRCLKNADEWTPTQPAVDDCMLSDGTLDPTRPLCLLDSTPPSTTLSVGTVPYDVSAVKKIPMTATDTVVVSDKLTTRVCFAPAGQSCYPTKIMSDGDGLPTPEQLPKGQSAPYVVRYYSEDGHGNVEPVRQASLQLRGDGIPRLVTVRVEER